MSSGLRNGIISLFCLGLLVAAWFVPGWRFERALRKAAYQRYSELGEPDRVKEAVDRHHAEVFDQCFVDGLPRNSKNFDVKKYARLMDQRVEKDLGDALADKLAAVIARQEGASPAPATAPAPAARVPAPTPAPAGHAVEIRGMQVKPRPGEAGGGKAFDIQIDVEDAARDITNESPASLALVVSCPGGEPFTAEAAQISATAVDADGISHLTLPLS